MNNTIKYAVKNKLLLFVIGGLILLFLILQFTGRKFCDCSSSDKFDPTKPGIHHK